MAHRVGATDLPARGFRGRRAGGNRRPAAGGLDTPDRAADGALSATAPPVALVDAHCHLQHPAFDADRDAVIARARAAGVERLLIPGYDLVSSRRAVELADAHPGLMDAAVGVHPHSAAVTSEAEWAAIEALAAHARVAAVGEIGLDFFRNLAPAEAQREAFARQLALAARLGKPVVVHDRDAHADVRRALLDWTQRSDRGGILHAYSGDAPMGLELAAAGFVISFALPLTFRSADGPRAAAQALPEGSFLVETDSPWLAAGRGRRNEPTTAVRVATELARLRGVEATEIASDVSATYRRLLGH